jgi:hypothetical protein
LITGNDIGKKISFLFAFSLKSFFFNSFWIAARTHAATLWITQPKETQFFLEMLLSDLEKVRDKKTK